VAKLSVFDAFPDETLLDSARQRAYFGGVSEMFLHRCEQASRRERERRKRDGLRRRSTRSICRPSAAVPKSR
jgi:hypothetical protein